MYPGSSKVGRESGVTSLSLQHRSGPLAAHCQLSVVQLYGSASGNNMSAGWRILHAQIGISINHILRSDRLGVNACQTLRVSLAAEIPEGPSTASKGHNHY